MPPANEPFPSTPRPPAAPPPDTAPHPPLVLVHGLFDTPRLFDRLRQRLGGRRDPLLVPYLPHALGSVPLEELAVLLGQRIEAAFGAEQTVDVLGFSMGGVISRTWIQLQGGHRRTRRFLSVASPQQGTLAALPWPRWALAGLDDMKPGSALLRRLAQDLKPLQAIDCSSFFCPTDLTVVPGWRAVLPLGRRQALPVLRHDRVLAEEAPLASLIAELLRP